ncbi:MAG: cation:proton antiporter [Nanoarchaeota archaeon]
MDIFFNLGIMIIIATVFAFIAKILKQPLIPAYILTGILIGPYMHWITGANTIELMSEIGIAFLLFIVGLEIDIRKLRNIGLVSTLGGTIQILTLFSIGFIVASIMGFIPLEAIYFGIIISFSSTMVVLKLLSDKRELDTLHGRIIIGILLMQDIFAIFALSILGSLNKFSFWLLTLSLLKACIVIVIALFASKHVFPKIFKIAAKSQELLLLIALFVCFLFSILFNYIGFSIVIGAFVAGVTLANLPYNIEIISKVRSLRDFFATIFFISLGMELTLGSLRQIVIPLIIMLVILIIIKPWIIMFITSFFGYTKRTSFYTGMSLAQISEFSLIIVSQGLVLGHLSPEFFSITIILAIVTITITSYFVKYDHILYHKSSKKFSVLDKFAALEEELEYQPKSKADVILCGHNRIGYGIARTIRRMRRSLIVVDFNPELIKYLIRKKIPCIYGDLGDIELIERLPLKTAKMVISTVPDIVDNLLLIKKVKHVNKDAILYVTANQVEEALSLYDEGADYVILPHFLGGDHLSILIEDFTGDVNKIIELKLKHIKELHQRKYLGHEHPTHN